MKITKTVIIPRATVNNGYTVEESFFEGIDNVLDVADEKTKIECFMYPVNQRISYMICDNSGGANVNDIFSLKTERTYAENYESIIDLHKKIGLFGAGSFSHTNVSNDVWFFTKEKEEWKSIHLTKVTKTGDFKKEHLEGVIPNEIIPKEFLNMCNIQLDFCDTIIYADKVKLSTNQKIQDFQFDLFQLSKGVIGNQFIKNLRCTYEQKLKEGYQIHFNGNLLKPLDIFYKDDVASKHIATLKITLKQLLEYGHQFEEEILEKYLTIYEKAYEETALEILMNEFVEIECYSLAREYINLKKVWNSDDKVKCNPESSGFWLFRNGRRIDNPFSILPLKVSHPSNNGFRASITFSPIFDDFFGIQTNKNRAIISNEFKAALTDLFEKYKEEHGVDILEAAKMYKVESSSEQQSFWDSDKVKLDKDVLKGLKDWKKAEVIATLYFEKQGFDVKDVTDKQISYDLYVEKESENYKKYVEVKLDKKGDGVFTLTDNEYLLASQQKENYVVCIVTIKQKTAIIKLFENPVDNVEFKEIKSWRSSSKYGASVDYVEFEDE